MKIIQILARALSWIFSPLLLPVYGVALSFIFTAYSFMPLSVMLTVIGATLLITCVVPAVSILCMYALGYVSDPGLNRRSERLVPYIVALVCYMAEVYYLDTVGAPRWMCMFMVAAACIVVVSAIVNLRWKISGHMAGIGGLTALMFRFMVSGIGDIDMLPYVAGSVLLCGMLGSSRIVLGCHTLGQVAAGCLNGFLWVYFLT